MFSSNISSGSAAAQMQLLLFLTFRIVARKNISLFITFLQTCTFRKSRCLNVYGIADATKNMDYAIIWKHDGITYVYMFPVCSYDCCIIVQQSLLVSYAWFINDACVVEDWNVCMLKGDTFFFRNYAETSYVVTWGFTLANLNSMW